MNDLKLVLGVVIGSALLVALMIFGLSKMSSGTSGGTMADQKQLLDGALLVKGSTESAVTVVNFSDVQCPACKSADSKLSELRNMAGVKMVFRHFPLQVHKNSVPGAKAVEASRQLSKGWEMIDLLFVS